MGKHRTRVLDCRQQIVAGQHRFGAANCPCCVLFSLYTEKAADHDQKPAENWREDPRGIMFLVRHASPFRRALQCSPKHRQSGLISALHLRQALKTSRPSVSATSPNCRSVRTLSSGAQRPPSPPIPAPPSTATNAFWFVDLELSLATAVSATLVPGCANTCF